MTDINQTLNNGTFCNLQVSIWTASKKVATGTVNLGETDETLFRVNKDLIERSALKPLRQVSQKASDILQNRALPFNIRGVYYIPNGLITSVIESIREYEFSFTSRVEEFCERYSQYRDQARLRLNSHFRDSDYPSTDKIRQKFKWNLQMMAFSAPDSLQSVSSEMYEEANRRFHQEIEDFKDNSVTLLRHKFSELVSHIVERLTPDEDGNKKIFRNSMVGNLKDFLNDFEALNLTNDHELAEQVSRTRNLVEGISPEDLRVSTRLSQMITQNIAQVQETVANLIENAPKRRIRYHVKDQNREEAA